MESAKDIQLSKKLSWVLRHGAEKIGLEISSSGYIRIKDILNNKKFKNNYTFDDIKKVVELDNKQRFNLRFNENNEVQICANQGHSLKNINIELTPVLVTEEITVIHGTFFKHWEVIKHCGLSCMKRQHIHFATGLPNDRNVISGIRKNAELFIYIDYKMGIEEGLKFYRSANQVILSPGNENGYILPKYFLKVTDVSQGNINC